MFEFLKGPSAPPSTQATDTDNGIHGPTPILERIKALVAGVGKTPPAPLKEEVAAPEMTGVRAMWDVSVASGLTPRRLAELLRESIRGDHRFYLELAEEMEERDLHYLSVLGTRKRALSQLRPSVEEAKGADAKIAEAVRALVEAPAFAEMLVDLCDAFGKGFSCVELVWHENDGFWTPAFVWCDPKYFTFDYISRSEVRLQRLGTLDGDKLETGKWIVHTPKIKSGIPIRGGFARLAAWVYLFNNYALKDWASFLDVYGMPIRVGKYHPSATPEERRKLLQAVMQIASDAAAIIPESMLIEFLEAKGAGSGTSTPFEQMGRYCNQQLSKAILGQTMTVESGGSLAQAQVHNQIRLDILQDDARQLANTLNHCLIAHFVSLNFGPAAKAPRVSFPVAEPQDVAALSNALALLVPLGLKVKASEVLEKIGLSETEDGDELLAAPVAAKPVSNKPPGDGALANAATNAQGYHLSGCPCCGETRRRDGRPALNASAVQEDEVEAIGADEAEDWEPVMAPLLRQLVEAAQKASSFEEYQAALKELTGELDIAALARRVAIAQMKARAFGNG
jgi:phage gp29-like protein